MAQNLQGADSLKDLARGQLTAAKESEEHAKANIAGSEEMRAKSNATQRIAEKRFEEARVIEKDARKQKNVAEGVKDNINSPDAVHHSQAGEISAMKQAGLQDIAAGKAAQAVATQEKATAGAIKKEINSLGDATKVVKSKEHTATSDGKQALAKTTKEDNRATEGMVQPVNEMDKFLANPQPMNKMMAAGKAKLLAAHARQQNMVKDMKTSRTCVHLPGVHLKVGKAHHTDSSHEQCIETCQARAGCKEIVYSQKVGCNMLDDATEEVEEYDDSYTSSYCGLTIHQNHMMDMLHQAYKNKPAQVVSK